MARWLAPSAAAACGGAIVAGVVEGAGMDSVFGVLVAAGFLGLFALPVLFAMCVTLRLLWMGWRPEQLGLVEDNGGAPRLVAWLVVLGIGALSLAWIMFQGTWQLATWTAFKPMATSLAEPLFAVVGAMLCVIASRPVARGVAALVRKLDRRWRGERRSYLTPRNVIAAAFVLAFAICYALWRIVIKRQLGHFDVDPLLGPVAGIAAAALVHACWRRLGRARATVGGVLGVAAAAAIGCALYALHGEPALTLSVWGDRPLAGFAIDRVFDLDAIRSHIPLEELRPAEQPGARHRDIILVTIDTVRADHTPPYGGSAEMPVLRELAARGVVFEWAFAPSNVTRRSLPSMILGLSPNRVRGRVIGWALKVDPRHVLLAERMRAAGYDTAGFVCCEGFWGKAFNTGFQRGLDHLEIEPNGLALAHRARMWLDAREQQRGNKPLFMWMHILEPHNWQQASGEPRNEDERRRYYDRSLQLSDTMLVDLIGAFAQRQPDDAPIIIVTADHGEGLGDHGQPYHSTDLYDSQIRVPLVIAGPSIKPARVAETVSLTDLTPTVLDLAGFVPPQGRVMDGRSIADLATGKRASNPDGGLAFAAMIKDRSNPGGHTAVISGRWKLIDNGASLELYDTRADPDEHSNLISTKAAILAELRRLLTLRQDAARISPF